MAIVTNTIKLPGGVTPTSAACEIELVASTTTKAAGWVTATDVTILATYRPTVAAGAWTADLTPNADISPTGTVYRINEYANGKRYTHYIEVGSGGGTVHDLLVDAPASLATAGSEAFTTAAVATHAGLTAGAHAATAVTVADSAGYFSGATVETALAEVGEHIASDAETAHSPSLSLRGWRAAVAGVLAGAADATILCIGDSTTAGLGGTSTSTSAPARMIGALSLSGIPAAYTGALGIDTANSFDPRFTVGSGWTARAFGKLGGGAFLSASGAAGTLQFTPGTAFDRIDLYTLRNPAHGTITVNIGGSTLATINCAGANGIVKTTISCTLGTNTVTVTGATGGAVYVRGITTRDSTTPRVLCFNGGLSGLLAAEACYSVNGFDDAYLIDTIDADLHFINLIINDSNAGTSLSAYTASLETVVNRCAAVGDVVMVVSCGSSPEPANYAAYKAAVYSFGLPVVDLSERWGLYADANAQGLMFDTVHPGNVGYMEFGAAMAERAKSY